MVTPPRPRESNLRARDTIAACASLHIACGAGDARRCRLPRACSNGTCDPRLPGITPLVKCVAPPRAVERRRGGARAGLPQPARALDARRRRRRRRATASTSTSGSRRARCCASTPPTPTTTLDGDRPVGDANKLSYGSGENGLLGLAFSPNWATNHTVYLSYTTPSAAAAGFDSVISRIASSDGGATLDPRDGAGGAAVRPAVHQPQRRQHPVRPRRLSLRRLRRRRLGRRSAATARRTPTLPFGKMLRIDVDGQTHLRHPADQPVRRQRRRRSAARSTPTACATRGAGASTATPAICGSATSGRTCGKRSTRSSSAATTAGTSAKASHCYNADHLPDCRARMPPDRRVRPSGDGPDDGGTSITGGYVYRGNGIPALVGSYIYADYGSGGSGALVYDAAGNGAASELLLDTGKNIVVVRRGQRRRALRRQLRRAASSTSWCRRPTQPGTSFPRAALGDRLRRPERPDAAAAGAHPVRRQHAAVVRRRRQAALAGAPRRRHRSTSTPTATGICPIGTVLMKEFSRRRQARRDAPVRAPRRRRVGRLQLRVERRRHGRDAAAVEQDQGSRQRADLVLTRAATSACSATRSAAGPLARARDGAAEPRLRRDGAAATSSRRSTHIGLFDAPLPAPAATLPAFPHARRHERARRPIARAPTCTRNCSFCHRTGGTGRVPPDWRCVADAARRRARATRRRRTATSA